MPLSEPYLWLIGGAVFMALEAFGIPGIGLVFAGLAAIIVGGLIQADIIEYSDHVLQFTLWFGMTVLTAITLWKPMKRWRLNPSAEDQFNNMIGTTATVTGGGLKKGVAGKAKWSGTTMSAKLADDAGVDMLEDGATAEVTAVKGTMLYLKPPTS